MSSDSPRNPLPFEPSGKRKKANSGTAEGKVNQKSAKVTQGSDPQASRSKSAKPKAAKEPQAAQSLKAAKHKEGSSAASRKSRSDTAIPEVVSRRMLRRMIVFSGIPTFVGVGIFFSSYFLLVNRIVDLPKYAVFFSTLGCFGLGVLGLSYGALSASWDENRLGGWFGASEFRTNFGRMTEAWRAARKSS